MKKLIAVLTLFLAFTINANAQDKNVSSHDRGKKDATELTEYLGLDTATSEAFARLFEQKYAVLEDKNVSQERKAELARVIEAKINATLNEKQMDKLNKNPELLKKLIN